MPSESPASAQAKSINTRLQRVADALDVPVGTFLGKATDPSIAQAAELFRLWQAIQDPDDREELLVTARNLVSRSVNDSAAAG